jgi:UDP-N-acetylenolpyruvoylglucosamine reductase
MELYSIMPSIKDLNDEFRTSGFRNGSTIVTPSVMTLPSEERKQLVEKVRTFKDFTEDNDPYGEHDFGSVTQNGVLYFWKIDYYNKTMSEGSRNPADEKVTTRVLTIMQAKEY